MPATPITPEPDRSAAALDTLDASGAASGASHRAADLRVRLGPDAGAALPTLDVVTMDLGATPTAQNAVTRDLAALIPDVRHPSVRAADAATAAIATGTATTEAVATTDTADLVAEARVRETDTVDLGAAGSARAGDDLPTMAGGAPVAPTLDVALTGTPTLDAGGATEEVGAFTTGDAGGMGAAPVARVAAALAGRYEVLRPLGRGGMATVYLARDVKHGREVAVKLLHPELGASIGGARFLQEIRLAATLQHPHVLGLYDSGEVDGLLYYVMPFVRGESLRDRLRREGQLPLGEALAIAGEVANALAYAHAQGVVHRDVKPENILLANGHAVVADFGIARAMRAAAGDRLTETGIAVGTPQYMSPEQGTGATDVGPPSDVYAAGCVLYEMLVGEPPFTGPNAMAIIARHAMAEVPSVRVVRSAVPPAVERLVACALAKTPVDRWASAGAFEQAIAAAAAQVAAGAAPTAAVPVGGVRRAPGGGGGGRAGWWPSDTPRRVALGGLALAVALAAGLGARRFLGTPNTSALAAGPDARRMAVMYFEAPDAALRPVADGLTESLAGTLGRVPGLEVTSAGGTLPYRGASVTLDSVARALGVGTLVTGRIEPEGAGQVRLTVTLRDASGAPFADSTLVRPAGDLLKLREDVVDQASALVRRRLGESVAVRASLAGTEDAQAWALVQQGLAAGKRASALALAGDDAGTAAADSAADRAFVAAAARDPRWIAPALERARLAYQQSRRRGADAAYAAPHVARAVALADAAVRLDSTSAAARAVRGTARYWEWLLNVNAPDDATREHNRTLAAADLERATREDATQADAWSVLSHYYVNFRSTTDAKLAALRAYQADAYLTGADALLARLYQTSYVLAQFDEARRYCGELGRRYPASFRTGECRVWLLSTPDAPAASPAQAWALADAYVASSPPAQRAANGVYGRIGVAAALAHAGLRDSARHVLDAALATPGVDDPKFALAGAWVRTTLGDTASAVALLTRFASVQGSAAAQVRRDVAENWWLRPLQGDPRFRALFNLE